MKKSTLLLLICLSLTAGSTESYADGYAGLLAGVNTISNGFGTKLDFGVQAGAIIDNLKIGIFVTRTSGDQSTNSADYSYYTSSTINIYTLALEGAWFPLGVESGLELGAKAGIAYYQTSFWSAATINGQQVIVSTNGSKIYPIFGPAVAYHYMLTSFFGIGVDESFLLTTTDGSLTTSLNSLASLQFRF